MEFEISPEASPEEALQNMSSGEKIGHSFTKKRSDIFIFEPPCISLRALPDNSEFLMIKLDIMGYRALIFSLFLVNRYDLGAIS